MSFVAEQLVGCIRGRQAEASGFGIPRELLALHGVFLENLNFFQLMVDRRRDQGGVFFLSFFVVHSFSGRIFCIVLRQNGLIT